MTAAQAERIATEWMTPVGFCRVLCDMAKADQWFAKGPDYIPATGDTERPLASLAFGVFSQSVKPEEIHGPVVMMLNKECGTERMLFRDGRHRFAVVRDAGAKRIVLNTDGAGKRIMIQEGIAITDNN